MTDKEIDQLLKDFGFPTFENNLEAAKHRILEIFDSTFATSAVTDGLTSQEMIDAANALGFEVIETATSASVSTVTIKRSSDERFASFHHFVNDPEELSDF